LLLAILLNAVGVLLAVLPPIARVLDSPLSWAVRANLPVLRIGSNLLAVVIVPPAPLTIGVAADRLRRLVLGGFEDLQAVAARPTGHESVVSLLALLRFRN